MNSSGDKPKLAIVGIGKWGKNLLREFSVITDVKLCFHLEDKGNKKWLKNNYPAVEITASYDEIVKDPTIDAIVIVTPINTHYELTKKALLAGKHVFVEKPMTAKSKEAEELVAIANRRKLVLFTGYIFLDHPIFKKIKEILEDKTLCSAEFIWNKYGTFNEDVIWNLLSHDMAIAISLFGEPASVSVLGKKGVVSKVDIIYVRAEFGRGRYSTFRINRSADKKEKTVTLFINNSVYLWRGNSLYKSSGEETKPELIYQSNDQSLALECKEFVTQIKNPGSAVRRIISLQVTRALESIAGN